MSGLRNDGDRELIVIIKYGAIWTNCPQKYRLIKYL